MTTRVITLAPENSAERAIETLVSHRISGAPVVDTEQRLLGVMSEYHLLKIASFPTVRKLTVGELMTKAVWIVSPDASLVEAAELLARHRIRRLPVVDQGRVVGIVSRRDVIQHLLTRHEEIARRSDFSRICDRLIKSMGPMRPPRHKRIRPEALSGAAS